MLGLMKMDEIRDAGKATRKAYSPVNIGVTAAQGPQSEEVRHFHKS
jgi:hypothetical protein